MSAGFRDAPAEGSPTVSAVVDMNMRIATAPLPWNEGEAHGNSESGKTLRGGEADVAGLTTAGAHDDRDPLRDPRLLIIEDCTLDRENLVAAFTADGAAVAPVGAWDLPSLFTALRTGLPDLVLINMATRDSAKLLNAIFDVSPRMKVIVLGIAEEDEEVIVACAEAGVSGYHLRNESLDDLLELIRRVADGETSCPPRISTVLLRRLSALATQRQPEPKELVLTPREEQILRLLDMRLSNREIASQLCISVHTVKNHVHSLLTKLGVSTRTEAAVRARTASFTVATPEN